MFPSLFSLFAHLRPHYRLVAYGLTLLVVVGVMLFYNEPVNAKLAVFGIIAVILGFTVWTVLKKLPIHTFIKGGHEKILVRRRRVRYPTR